MTVLTSDQRVAGVPDPVDDSERGIHRDLRAYWRDHELLSPLPWIRMAIERHNQRILSRVLDERRPDVVSVWNMGAVSLGLLTTLSERGVPMVLNVCNDWLVYGPLLDAWQRVWRDRPRTGRMVERVLGVPTFLPDLSGEVACFVSENVRREAERETSWEFEHSTVVYSGIERDEFRPDDVPHGGPWRWRLLFVGRLDPRKGLDTLIDAMSDLPDEATLEILGRGDAEYTRRLRDRIDLRGLSSRVRIESVPRSLLARRYRRADVLVFPSEWEEPFGLVPVEAMACGTPVVATGTGGSGEFLVDDVNCLCFPAGDAAALVRCVRRLADKPETRERVISGGLTTAEELDTDRLADVLEAWHQAAADHFRDGTPEHRASIRDHVLG